MATNNEPDFVFEGPALFASAARAQLLARRRGTFEHDLKNVVHGLVSGTELLRKALATQSPRISPAECLTLLQQQLERAQSTLDLILNEIAPLDDELVDIDFGELVNECTHAVRHQLQLLDLQTSIEASLTIRAHRTRLKEALLCVLLDCIDAAPNRSTLRVTLAAWRNGDAKALLRIQHAQDPARPRSPTLQVMTELLQAEDAVLEVDSIGTEQRVAVSLPLVASQLAKASATLRVLIVDANRDAADSLAMLAQLSGYDAQAVYDAEATVQAARAAPPAAVLVDLDGSIDSDALIRRLRDQPGFAARIIGVSYSADRGSPAAIDAQLRKPLEPSALQALLAKKSARD